MCDKISIVIKNMMEGNIRYKQTNNKMSSNFVTKFVLAMVAAVYLCVLGNVGITAKAETVTNPTEYKQGDTVKAELNSANKAKWYKVVLDKSYAVELTATSSTTNNAPNVTVFDKEAKLSENLFQVSLNVSKTNAHKAVLVKGEYYVRCYAELSGSYNCDIDFKLSAQDEANSSGAKVYSAWSKVASKKSKK